MISKADYLLLKELKNDPKLREYFKIQDRVNTLINDGYIEIFYDKIVHLVVY